MLQHLVEHYLDSLPNERAFDAAFLALLAADGYRDIHFLHGALEFGKDVIAKRELDGELCQFAFQNKAGSMAMAEWRTARNQLFEVLTNPLGHIGFDADLPRTVVLVVTGRLSGNAAVDSQTFKDTVEGTFPKRRIEVWDRESLIALFLRHGPEQLFRSGVDIRGYGRFYRLYGDVLDKAAKFGDIDIHFEERLHAEANSDARLAASSIEAALFADVARRTEQPYLALLSTLAAMRAVLYEMQNADDIAARGMTALCEAAVGAVVAQASDLSNTCLSFIAEGKSLADVAGRPGKFVAYPVVCAQFMDALILLHAFGDELQRREAVTVLKRLVQDELGCAHPISDRYAVSVVLAIRVLYESGHSDAAKHLLKEAALWLIDRYWDGGFGLASSDATEEEEVRQLLGGSFSGVDLERESASLLACALMDAACLLQDESVFLGLRADILAADIVPRYYQAQDTPGQFEVSADDVVRFPNVEFSETMPLFAELRHGQHLYGEPQSFRLASLVPKGVYAATALLLRDRYFPTTWVPS